MESFKKLKQSFLHIKNINIKRKVLKILLFTFNVWILVEVGKVCGFKCLIYKIKEGRMSFTQITPLTWPTLTIDQSNTVVDVYINTMIYREVLISKKRFFKLQI